MLRVLVVLVVMVVPRVVLAAPEIPDEQLYRCKDTTGDVTVSFKPEIEIRELVTWASGYTCKEFIFEPRVVKDRKVTIIAPNRMSRTDAWRMFLAALQTANYTVVSKGNMLKIVDAPTARKENIKLTRSPDGSEQIVRYVYRPEHATAESLVQAFTTLKSDAGDVMQVNAMLLITDYASHVKEMINFAKLVDVPKGSEAIYLLPLKFADSVKVTEYLNNLFGQAANQVTAVGGKPGEVKQAGGVPSKIIAETRTNTLILSATEATYNRVKALVEVIDVELEIEGGAKFHVYRLQSGVAEDMAKTLNDMLGQSQRTQQTPSRPNVPQVPAGAQVPDAGASIEGQVRIVGEKLTNSLIVMSTGRDFLAIKELIKQLDVARRQVYIEVVILETSSSAYNEVGVTGHGGIPGTKGSMVVGGVQMPTLRSTDARTLASATGMVGALIGANLPGSQALLGRSIPSYALMFQALAGSGGGRVHSTTWVLGLDNKETKQSVGIDIPYLRGTVQGVGDNQAAVQQFDRRKLPQELAITPHISTDDTVLLDIAHTAEELGEQSDLGPTWNTRALTTSVVVRDQMTVVVGGLAQERTVRSQTKVPLLGDLPILGYLFKYTKKDTRKTHLLIMLTPYIIKDHRELQEISERKQREHQELADSFHHLDNAKYQPKLDYSRKRGVVEEINRTLQDIDEEIVAREQIRQLPRIKAGPIQPSTE